MKQRRFLVSQEWFESWMSFLYGESEEGPPDIDNTKLANLIINQGFSTLIKNIDYYELPYQTWRSLLEIYRAGPTITINFNGKIEIEPFHEPK